MRPGYYGWDARIYRIWVGMKNRCQNPNNYSYPNYGGRGIKVCSVWQDYQPFLDWSLANGYADGLSIDRIDNEGDYCPANCRWATRREQNCNTRQNHFLTYAGKTQTISQWGEEIGITEGAIISRLKLEWPLERILSVKDGKREQAVKYSYNGKTLTLREWSKELNISKQTLKGRLRKYPGNIEKILAPLPKGRSLISFNGITMTRSEWAREIGVDVSYLCRELRANRSLEDIMLAHQRHVDNKNQEVQNA